MACPKNPQPRFPTALRRSPRLIHHISRFVHSYRQQPTRMLRTLSGARRRRAGVLVASGSLDPPPDPIRSNNAHEGYRPADPTAHRLPMSASLAVFDPGWPEFHPRRAGETLATPDSKSRITDGSAPQPALGAGRQSGSEDYTASRQWLFPTSRLFMQVH